MIEALLLEVVDLIEALRLRIDSSWSFDGASDLIEALRLSAVDLMEALRLSAVDLMEPLRLTAGDSNPLDRISDLIEALRLSLGDEELAS